MNEILKVVDKLQKLVQNIQKTKLRVEKKKLIYFGLPCILFMNCYASHSVFGSNLLTENCILQFGMHL